tara:strand:- start:315 stop:449 length:135 start_codon:yes stop_codon:yes gene_type:complete
MSTIKRLIKDLKVRANMTPVKVVELSSGVTTKIYANGTVDVIKN